MMHSRPPARIVGLGFANITVWTRTIGEGGTMSASTQRINIFKFQMKRPCTRARGPGPAQLSQLLTRTASLPAQARHNL